MGKAIDNMVDAANHISSSFKNLKIVTITSIVAAVLCAFLCVAYTMNTVQGMNGKIYVLDKGQAFSASLEDSFANREDEVIEQSKRFLKYFFTITPNREILQENIENAMRLCADRSAYDYYNAIQEQGFYRRFFQAQAIQEIQVDSVRVNMHTYPYQVVASSSLYVTRPTLIVKNRLITNFSMIDTPREPGNLNGLKIENFVVSKNKEIERRKR